MRSLLGVLNAVGSLLALFALYYALPLVTAFVYREAAINDFAIAAGITFAIGMGLKLVTQRFASELKPRDGYLLVTISWLSIAGLATVPLMRQIPQLSFTDAFFETMSGLSTTGATILTGIDRLPHAVNLWREALSWLGGMGIIVMAVAILPLLGVGGMQMYRAESPGSVKDARLTSRIIQTAKLLWLVYVGITALCALSLWLAGMDGFDAICHAFATVGLGGFSTHDANIGYFNSPAIELVLIVFMLLAAMNFSTHFTALRRGSFKPYSRDPEARWLLVWIVVSCFGVAAYVRVAGVYPDYFTALRNVGFNLVSIATTSGFVSTNYGTWPVFAPMWMLFLSCLCASSGSTGGGIKMFRSLVLIKQSMREMFSLVHPSAVAPLKIAGTVIANRVVFAVLGFIFIYFMTIVVLTFALLASGLDFISAFSAIIACINNAGPGLGVVGPSTNYAALTDFQTWVCTAAMFLGRIELFTCLVIFTRTFWRK